MSAVETAVFLAAGRGNRLRPYTDHTPKPLLPVAGRPTLDFALTAAVNAGIRRVLLVTHYLQQQIRDYVANGERWGVELDFAHQPQLLGTGNALLAAVNKRPDWFRAPFLLSATDYIFPADYFQALVRRYGETGAQIVVSMKAVPAAELQQRSSVRFGGDLEIAEIVEKPAPGTAPSRYAANLIYILPAQICPILANLRPSARGEIEVQTAVNRLLAAGAPARGLLQDALPEWSPPRL